MAQNAQTRWTVNMFLSFKVLILVNFLTYVCVCVLVICMY